MSGRSNERTLDRPKLRLRWVRAATIAAIVIRTLPAFADDASTPETLDAASKSPGEAATPPTAPASAAAPPATAAEAPAPAPYRPVGRELGGHTYLPTLSIVGPFAATSFGTFLTAGAGTTKGSVTLEIPGSSAPPQTFTGSVSYAAIGGVIGVEYAFLRDFAARLLLSETLYSGTTGAAAAVVGTNARLGADFGVTGGLPIGKSIRVSGVFDASFTPRLGILLGPAIKYTFDTCSAGATSCRFDFSKLFQQKNVLGLTPGVAAAWTPTKSLGLVGNFSYSYSSIQATGQKSASEGALSLGFAADFDFHALSSVPLGLQASIATEVPVTSTDVSSFTDLGGGIFYTGRDDLALGLQLIDRRFRVVPEVNVSWSTFVTSIGLRYYWL
jgi:hypothetical protein